MFEEDVKQELLEEDAKKNNQGEPDQEVKDDYVASIDEIDPNMEGSDGEVPLLDLDFLDPTAEELAVEEIPNEEFDENMNVE
ncbi:MAG: hypothetical protein IKM39_01660, partial [Clostridia bacterium]|nr:hypothetical protein [Clostridia bacterium]